jgi:hypothetical protein
VIYAGIVGSSLEVERETDLDVVAVTSSGRIPKLIHEGDVSVLALDEEWLLYDKHEKEPVGLVPSVLFKAIQMPISVVGDKRRLCIPKICVCKADFVNGEIKRK